MSIKEFIEQSLQKRAQEEPQFALKLQNKNKSLDECVKYIYGEVLNKYVKEHRGAQAAAVERDELVGMAVHYYDENDIKIRPLTGVVAGAASGRVRKPSESKPKAKDKKTVKKPAKVAKNPTVEDLFFGTLFDASMFE